MRKQTKTIVIIVCVAILAGLLYTGGVALFAGAQQGAMAAVAKVNGKTITYYELQQVFFSELQELAQQKGSISGETMKSLVTGH